MEQVILINGKEEVMKANAKTVFIYKANFDEDIMADTFLLLEAISKSAYVESMENSTQIDVVKTFMSSFDSTIIYQLVWTYLKAKDKDTIPFESWLENVEDSPLDLAYQESFLEIVAKSVKKKI